MNDLSSFYRTLKDCGGLDDSFDRHILGRLLLHAAFEADKKDIPLAYALGLGGESLSDLIDYLHVKDYWSSAPGKSAAEPDDEELMLRDLLVHSGGETKAAVQWLPAIIARRSMEPNHLWEDLGLARRPDLTSLLSHFFPVLACKNTRNMRWKRFLYRSLCEAEGFTMCPSPTCDSCSEFHVCYGDDSGEAVMARNQRAANLAETNS